MTAPEGIVRRLTVDEAQATIDRIEARHPEIRGYHDTPDVCCRGCRETRFQTIHGWSAEATADWSEYTTVRYLMDGV